MEQTTNQPDLLQDLDEGQYVWTQPASTGKRFVNYLVDLVSFYALILASGILGGLLFEDAFIDALDAIPSILDRLITLVLFGIYISIMEGITKGRTLGKLVTGTRAVRIDGNPFGWGDAFGRGFSRMVPFEQLSAFGTAPWHDTWTKTKVIDIN